MSTLNEKAERYSQQNPKASVYDAFKEGYLQCVDVYVKVLSRARNNSLTDKTSPRHEQENPSGALPGLR